MTFISNIFGIAFTEKKSSLTFFFNIRNDFVFHFISDIQQNPYLYAYIFSPPVQNV